MKRKSEPRNPSTPSTPGDVKSKGKCFGCGQIGHKQTQCSKNPLTFRLGAEQGIEVGFCFDDPFSQEYVVAGNGVWVSTVLRDTGCSCIIVSENVLPDLDSSRCKKSEGC